MIRTALASALTAVFCSFGPAIAQDADWQMNCSETGCNIIRSMTENTTGRLVATFLVIVENGKADTPGLGVALPLGLAIEPGVRIVSGEQTIDLPFQVCFPDGCRAIRAATADEITLLTNADEADIRFFPFGQNRPTSVKVPMAGLSDALAQAQAKVAGN